MNELFDKFDKDEHDAYLARLRDKQTSHAGADHITKKLGKLHRIFLDRLGDFALTANEVADGNESIRKRALELVRKGVLAEVGVRRCRVTGQNATVYKRKLAN